MTKNLGPSISAYNDPEGRAWETVVFQAGKPVLDRELNLSEDIDGGAAQAALREAMPSGWLSEDFLNTSSATSAIFTPTTTPNTISIPRSRAHLNGWLIDVSYTENSAGGPENLVDLGPGPGTGLRTDLVILEAWRCLISADPGTPGKSPAGRIWRNGNVKIDLGLDTTLNYDSDILDTNVGVETTKRVQIQYRLRVISDVDIFTYPYGIDDLLVLARTVPSSAGPDGDAYAGTNPNYVNQSASGDPGLWVAGDGDPANGLGTVDGYMYAMPLVAVFRRNTTAFSHATNQNGGVASPGTSDRPDGLLSDIIAGQDLLDLRHGVQPTGWSYAELLEKNSNAILDNSLRTEVGQHSYGGGAQGTTLFLANDIGGAQTSAAPESGMQKFDAIRRRFSDRSIYETVTVKLSPPAGNVNWPDTATVTIDPAALPVYPYAAFTWSAAAPAGVLFLDVLGAHFAGTTAAHQAADAEPYIVSINGVGSTPLVSLTLDFASLSSLSLTDESLYVTLLVGYPRGVGLTHTPVETYGANSFALTTAALSPTAPVSFASFGAPGTLQAFDAPHREVRLEYETQPFTGANNPYVQGSGTAPTNLVILPERAIAGSVSVTTTPSQAMSPSLSDSGREVTLSTVPNPGTLITVNYTATRPMPASGTTQIAVYFRAAAPQMARNALISGSLTVVPRLTASKLLSLTTGSGSQGESYPFATAYVQTGGIFPSQIGTYSGEQELAGMAEISVANFDAATGMLNLPTYVTVASNPEALTFTRGLSDIDVEGRTYFPSVPAGYIPNAYAQDLSNPDRHKNVLPILAELASDSALGHRGQLVIILLLRYALFDEVNGVFFDNDPSANTTTASVFRVKGLLLSKRAS